MTFVNDNNEVLETTDEVAITKQAVSFFGFKIKGDYSVNFKVPNNSVTRRVLNYEGPQMINQVAFTRQSFTLMRDGNPFLRGSIVIQDDEAGYLDCYFVSGNSNWVSLLNGLITELDWTSYATKMTLTNITSTLKNATTGIIFPVADWTSNYKAGYPMKYLMSLSNPRCDINNNKEKSILDFYPCLYLSSLVQECLAQNGIKLSGNIINDPLYKSLVVSPVNGTLKRNAFNSVSLIGSSQAFVANGAGTFNSTNSYKNYTTVSDPDGVVNVSSGVITPNVTKTLQFKITVTASTAFPINFEIFKNGGTIAGGMTANFAGDSSLVRVSMNAGDTFTIQGNWLSVGTPTATANVLITTPEVITMDDWVDPSNFLPAYKSIDIVKFIVAYFGCSVYYNPFSATLSVNIIEKLKPESAPDWSDYYISHRAEYTIDSAQNNYLRFDSDDLDTAIKSYNEKNKKGFGDGLIQTGNTLKNEQDLVKFPFAASSYGLSINGIYESSIPLVSFSDDGEAIPFTVLTDLGGDQVRVTWSGPDLDTTLYEVVRIVDSSGRNLGYFTALRNPLAPGTFDVYMSFKGTTTGMVYRQTANYNTIKPRLLVVRTGGNTYDFTTTLSGYFPNNSTGIYLNKDGVPEQTTGLPYAFFCKSKTGATIDNYVTNAAIDNPDVSTFKDNTVNQLYYNKLSHIMGNPIIRMQMLLPEAVFQSFEFGSFIYVKTETLDGYFFVDSIVNYRDGNTPVEVNLYML